MASLKPIKPRKSKKNVRIKTSSSPHFPIDFFEHCQVLNDVEFGGKDILQVYNVQQVKHRLMTAGMYIACTKVNIIARIYCMDLTFASHSLQCSMTSHLPISSFIMSLTGSFRLVLFISLYPLNLSSFTFSVNHSTFSHSCFFHIVVQQFLDDSKKLQSFRCHGWCTYLSGMPGH